MKYLTSCEKIYRSEHNLDFGPFLTLLSTALKLAIAIALLQQKKKTSNHLIIFLRLCEQ